MNRARFESNSPNVALALAAVFMACTTLGVFVLLPASLYDEVTAVATRIAAARQRPAPGQGPANAPARSPTTPRPSMENRS